MIRKTTPTSWGRGSSALPHPINLRFLHPCRPSLPFPRNRLRPKVGLENSEVAGGIQKTDSTDLIVSSVILQTREPTERHFWVIGAIPAHGVVTEVPVSKPDFLGTRIGSSVMVVQSNIEGRYITLNDLEATHPQLKIGDFTIAWPLPLLIFMVPGGSHIPVPIQP